MMANHSAQYPSGYLDKETFKSFFAISGTSGKFTYQPGYERIPDNWYKRPVTDEYTIAGCAPFPPKHTSKAKKLVATSSTSSNSASKTPVSSPSAATPAPPTPSPASTPVPSAKASSMPSP